MIVTQGIHDFFSRDHKSNKGGWQRGIHGYYVVKFVERMARVSSKEIELRQDYATQFIAVYLHTDPKLIRLKLKKQTQTLTTVDDVYYVSIGKVILGKISISTQRAFQWASLIFIYQEKTKASFRRHKPFSREAGYRESREYARERKRNQLHRKRDE